MATALEDMTECPICTEIFKEPLLLSCNHTLCKICVSRIKEGGKVKCPMCKNVSEETEIKPDFRLAQFLDALAQQVINWTSEKSASGSIKKSESGTIPKKTLCELCEEKQILFRCEDCCNWICRTCKKIHSKISDCDIKKLVSLKQRNDDVLQQFEEKTDELKAKIGQYRVCVDILKREIKSARCTEAESLRTSSDMRRMCVQEVNAFYDQIDKNIISSIRKSIATFETDLARLEQKMRHIQHEVSQLERFARETRTILAIDGEAAIDRASQAVASFDSPELHTKAVCVRLKRNKDWNATAAFLELATRDIVQKFQCSVTNGQVIDASTNDLSPEKDLNLPSPSYSIRIISNHLWCCHEGGITIYNEGLQVMRRIAVDNVDITDVAEVQDTVAVVVRGKGIHHLSQDGNTLKTIEAGSFLRVQYHSRHLYATEFDTHSVHVYDVNSGFKKVRILRIPCAGTQHFTTLSVVGDTIATCCAEANRLYIIAPNGALKYTRGGSGSRDVGYFQSPYICQQDRSGILVADRRNQRLQVLDKAREWHPIVLSPAMDSYPHSAVYWNNKLYVLSWRETFLSDGGKLTIYSTKDLLL